MLALLLLLPSLLALHLETPITQQSKLLILDEDSLHPWFAGGNQIFIDWEHTHARQLVISNPSRSQPEIRSSPRKHHRESFSVEQHNHTLHSRKPKAESTGKPKTAIHASP